MYNLYRFEKDEESEEKRMNHAKSMKMLHRHRKKERNMMVENYKKRVTDFVVSLEKTSVQPNDEYMTRLKKEESNRLKHKFMGQESMVYSTKSEQERIQNSKHSLLYYLNTLFIYKFYVLIIGNQSNCFDTDIGDKYALKLRPQDKSKEIGSPLRYTFRSDVERIYEQLNDRRCPSIKKNLISNDFDKQMTNFKKNYRSHLGHKTISEKTFLSPKKLFEDLHQKTHYQAAYTIYLNYKSCLQDKAAKEMRRDEDLRESI
jgi:hypothetical protein